MDASSLTIENIGAMAGVGLVAAWLAAAKYLKERKAGPSASTSDVILAGGTIADMRPVREIELDMKRIAAALEGILRIMRDRQEAEAAAEEDELRDRIRDLERSLQDVGRTVPPRRRRT